MFENDQNISPEEKETAKQNFIEKLGPFKDEFDQKNGIAIIDFADTDDEGGHGIKFDIENRHDFMNRWNEYIRRQAGHQ